MGVLPFEFRLDLNKLNFMSCILHNSLTSTFIRNSAWDEMQLLGIKYNITDLKRKCSFKYFVWSKLEHLVKNL